VSIGPLYGLSMLLDMMADDYRLPSYEVAESDARKAFLSAVPRKSKEIKAAVMSACALRGWPALDSHSCDAIVVALHVLAHLEPGTAVEATPLFQGDRRCTDGRKANATTLSRRGRATQPAS
ncbi:MAG: hypothetical protein KGL35_15275, partial [Bradyrhizobium sp.]|nr:hypothetical protein [Bradyrhizobium sp.]